MIRNENKTPLKDSNEVIFVISVFYILKCLDCFCLFAATLKINKEIKGVKRIQLLPASFVCFQEPGMTEL